MTPTQRELLDKLAMNPKHWNSRITVWGAKMKTAESLEQHGYIRRVESSGFHRIAHPGCRTYVITPLGQRTSGWKN